MSISFDFPDETAPALSLGVYVRPDLRPGAPDARPDLSFTNAIALPRLQRVAERRGVVPTYLVPFVALGHRELRARLADWSSAGRAEVGALVDTLGSGHGRSAEEVVESVERVTAALAETVGVRPVTVASDDGRCDAQAARDVHARGYRVVVADRADRRVATAGLSVVRIARHEGRLRRTLAALAPRGLRPPTLDATAESGRRLDSAVDWLSGRLLDQVLVTCTTRDLCAGCGPRSATAFGVERAYRRLERVLRRTVEDLGARPRALCATVLVPPAALRVRARTTPGLRSRSTPHGSA